MTGVILAAVIVVAAMIGALLGATIVAAATLGARSEHPDVEPGLARLIAGHVAVGLARHAEDTEDTYEAQVAMAAKRARLSLNAIRVLIANATTDGAALDTLKVADALGYREDDGAKVLELRPERTRP